MESRANFVLIGGAVVTAVALLMVFTAWLAGSDWRSGYHVFDVVFDGPIRGLSQGGEVRFNGIKVGEVKTLRLDESNASRVIARIQVDAETPVRADSEAKLEAVGLTGVTLIQLGPGTPQQPLLRPRLGDPPPRLHAAPGAIDSLLSDDNAERITEILRNLREISARLAANDSVLTQSATTARDIAEAARAVTQLSNDTRTHLSSLTTRADSVLAESQTAVAHANEAMARLQDAAATASNETLPEVTSAAQDLRRLSRALERLSSEVESNPTSFIGGRQTPQIQVRP